MAPQFSVSKPKATRLHIKRFYQSSFTALIVLVLSAACSPQSSPQNSEPTATEVLIVATPVPTLALRPIDTPSVVAVAQATIAPTLTTDPSDQSLDVYPAPDGTSAVIRKVNATAPFKIVGRTADNTWIQVTYDDGLEGWVIVTAFTPRVI